MPGPEAAPAPAAFALIESVLLFALAVALSILWFQIIRKIAVRVSDAGAFGVHPFKFLHGWISTIDRWIHSTEAGTERAVVWSIHSLMWTITRGAKDTRDLAEATASAVERLVRGHVSQGIAKQPVTFEPRIKTLEREYHGIDERVDRLENHEHTKSKAGAASSTPVGMNISGRVKTLEKEYVGIDVRVDRLEHGQSHAGARAKPGEAAIPRTVPRAVPRTKGASKHWTDILTKSAAAALVGTALARLGLRWVRCPNVGKFGRWLCGTPSGLMDALLAGLTLVIATEGLVPFAHQVEGLFDGATGFVRKFWHVDVIGPGGDRPIGQSTVSPPG